MDKYGFSRGTDDLTRRINAHLGQLTTRTQAGMWEAALEVQALAQSLTPVKTGNLKGSAYVTVFKTAFGWIAEIGFYAAYAIWVHERVELTHTNGEAGFLRKAVERLEARIIEIITRSAKG